MSDDRKAPERIWFDPETGLASLTSFPAFMNRDVEYIRADLARELAEAVIDHCTDLLPQDFPVRCVLHNHEPVKDCPDDCPNILARKLIGDE